MKVFRIFIQIIAIFIFFACNSKSTKPAKLERSADSLPVKTEVIQFPDLVPGEEKLEENCFGEIVELKGQQKATEAIFEVRETQMLVKGNLLIMANLNNENRFMIFSLPDFKLLKSLGKMGRGPEEFQYPKLVPAAGDECLCYIYEQANDHLFSLNKDFSISELSFKLADATTNIAINDKQVASFSPTEFVYAESVKGGKAVFDFKAENDSVQNQMIFNLSFSESHKSWASYIGDFGANAQKQRLVYAYKYFKRLVFVDLKNNTSRTLEFKSGEAKKGDAISVMSPGNITHYWGMSAQKTILCTFCTAVARQ